MPPAKTKAKPRARSKKRSTSGWHFLWPILLGLILAPFAVRAASYLVLTGPSSFRLLMPFAVLLQSPSLGFTPAAAERLAQFMMYAQFPLYGLLFALFRLRWNWFTSLLLVILIHLAAFGAGYLLPGS